AWQTADRRPRAVMITAVEEAAPAIPIVAACRALRVPRATFYRSKQPQPAPGRRQQARALSPLERSAVLDVLHEARFIDLAPAQIYAALLDEGRSHCSEP